eukprot:NODE_123_length_17687_cov_0.732261.p14 type:complete len:119 gc:universal NODE_123_length_17687_cov_0.732261:10547-10903(+)
MSNNQKRKPSLTSLYQKYTNQELRKRAQERYCLELVLFKEDFEQLKQKKRHSDIDSVFDTLYRKYLLRGSPYELNLPGDIKVSLQNQFELKHYNISQLELVYDQVRTMITENLELNHI